MIGSYKKNNCLPVLDNPCILQPLRMKTRHVVTVPRRADLGPMELAQMTQ